MEIRGSRGGFVLFTPLFVDLPDAPVPLLYGSCSVAAQRFAGATEPDEPIVRIELARLRSFVDEVRVLERDRRGVATLLGPYLELALSVYDRAGHVRLAAALSDSLPTGRHHDALAFEGDPTALPHILTDLEDLLVFPRSNASREALER